MRAPIRLAILECDTPLPETKAKFNSYGGVFKTLLQASAESLDQPDLVHPESGLDVTCWHVEQNPDQYPKLEEIDAILITGSSRFPFSLSVTGL